MPASLRRRISTLRLSSLVSAKLWRDVRRQLIFCSVVLKSNERIITDSAFSPLAEHAQVRFDVVEADFAGFRSLSATMALAMALTVSVAQRRSSP